MNGSGPERIAVIGMACRLPGAQSPDEFWRNLREGRESIRVLSDEELAAAGVDATQRRDPRYVPAKGVLEDADGFDAGFFSVSPREAALMDPQQRIFLETSWSALEDAGYDPRKYEGSIAVFAGSILSMYLLRHLAPNREVMTGAGNFQIAVGNDPTFLATSTSYQLDLRGPSVSVGTACSTSLVAVHLACQSLLAHESDMALAGGVSVHLPLAGGYRYEEGGILSPDGHCRPFDAAAQGTVSSDGAGIVVLKRLSDAIADGDVIHAVIRGSAMNNDGRLKVGYTAPSARGEAQVIAEAMALAGVDPETVSMIEAHGAGTLLGDPIEVSALLEAFGDCGGRRAFCALGSVKSNIGHVDAAAGIAGLIKTVLALRHREIPPTLHFQRPNPQVDFGSTPFYVNDGLRAFPDRGAPLRAGVSSFGIGGTNVHVVLEEAPAQEQSAPSSGAAELFVASARTPSALERATDRLADHLEQNQAASLADIAHTLRHGRRAFPHRRALVVHDRDDAIAALRARTPQRVWTAQAPSARPSIAFMFPGLGDHYAGMGWEIYCTEPVFREMIDRCAGLLQRHLDRDIRDFLFAGRDWAHPVLERTNAAEHATKLDLRAMLGRGTAVADLPATAQPAIFAIELALVELLRSWDIEPEAMIGHSIGEFAAACVSGVLSLPDALQVVAARARLMESRVAPGAMLAVPLGEGELRDLLPAGVSLGAVNGARLCIASGEESGIAALNDTLAGRGISAQRLRSTHAYHSQMMEPLVEPLAALLRKVQLHPPRIPYVSCLTGMWITDTDATDPEYWARHLCRTVRFQQGLTQLLAEPGRVLLEVGPGQGLTSHAVAERTRCGSQQPVIPTMRWSYGLQSERDVLLGAVGQLWIAGAPLDTERFQAREGRRRAQLPTYPFERQRYWIDPPAVGEGTSAVAAGKRPDVSDWFYLPCWKPSARPRPRDGIAGENWLVFLDRHGVGAAVTAELRERGVRVATVEPGDTFAGEGDAFVIDPRRGEDYRSVIEGLCAEDRAPRSVVHLWSLTAREHGTPSAARFAAVQETGYSSILLLLQALGRRGLESTVRLELVSNHLYDVTGSDDPVPEKSTLRAPAMVAPQEHPGLVCRCIDLDTAVDDPDSRRALVADIVGELTGEECGSEVAYRSHRRWVPAYEPVRLEAADDRLRPFRQRGVYLLTGGLGGVGLLLARHLARTSQARLVLTGRSPFPARPEWERWLAEHDAGDSTSRRIEQVLGLEELGAEVLVLRADVARADDMRRVLEEIDARFGALHGVIHAAGAIGVETFREVRQAPAADAEGQFVAKVRGLLVLDELLAGRSLDFCLLMSSLSAILGGLGFTAYSAANLFMDAFARWKNRESGTVWTSVDWDSWRLADTRPVIAGLGATVSEFVMEPEEGAEACERILAEKHLGHVVVSSGDLGARLRLWIERRGQTEAVPAIQRHDRPSLATEYEAPRGELEGDLAEIWQELFGVASIGVHDNFFALGGHSLLATQLNARLSSKLHVEMSLAALLQAPTIADLAVAIVTQQAEMADPEMLEEMLAELGELSNSTTGAGDE
jgi:phthiocerol/phenolphthiocerol synthesis type-I polyketide synthase E